MKSKLLIIMGFSVMSGACAQTSPSVQSPAPERAATPVAAPHWRLARRRRRAALHVVWRVAHRSCSLHGRKRSLALWECTRETLLAAAGFQEHGGRRCYEPFLQEVRGRRTGGEKNESLLSVCFCSKSVSSLLVTDHRAARQRRAPHSSSSTLHTRAPRPLPPPRPHPIAHCVAPDKGPTAARLVWRDAPRPDPAVAAS